MKELINSFTQLVCVCAATTNLRRAKSSAEMKVKMTKIDIFSGFLGAGKTTLIKKMLKEAFGEEKIVLIENEFGEIGIDGGFLKESGIEITEMNSGCICCTLVGDFSKALQDVLEKFNPDRVLIEPSGVGKLSDVIQAVNGITKNEDVVLNSFVTVVDGSKFKMYRKNFGEFFNNQIEYAKTIVLSRTQNMSLTRLEECAASIREVNKNAALITTPWEELSGTVILSAMEAPYLLEEELRSKEMELPNHSHDGGIEREHHHADEIFESLGMETTHQYHEAEIKDILSSLAQVFKYGIVLRAKGIVAANEGEWFHFDYVPDEIQIRRGSADYTGRICVIGSNLNKEALKTLFQI